MEETRAWHSRPGVARALRIGIVVAPILITIVLVTIVSRGFPRPDDLLQAVGWWIAISLFATLLLAMVDRLFRRLLPIAALFKISLVFPDSAPSRFSTALRVGTVKQLKRKMAAGELEASTPQEAAEQLIGIAAALNAHDRLTRGHTERVRAYSVMIGEEMGLDEHEVELLNWSGLIHDVGKLHVPTEILNKPGRPDDDEWAILKEHPSHGGELIDPLRGFLGDFAESATQHHEKFDGTGYPLGLAGEEITLAGRIVAVADAYDVMTSTRSYKKPMSAEAAREELAKNSGTQFDPEVVRAFLNIALGHLRLVAGPLAGLAQLPLPTAATAGAGSAAATGASAAATIAVATVSGLVDPVPPEDPPEAVALVDVEAQDIRADGIEDETFLLDLRSTLGDVGVDIVLPIEVEGVETQVSPDGVLSIIPAPNRNGEVEVPYRLCVDDQCDDGVVVVDFAAVNDAPTASADALEAVAGETIVIDVLANDTDPDGEQLQLAAVSAPSSGEARIVDNQIEFTAPAENAVIELLYTAVDGAGEVAEQVVTITVVRPPVGPTAVDDQIVISEDSVARFDPSTNDIAGDVALDPDSITIIEPAVGVARVIDGTIEWVPDRDWNGTIGLTYRICDVDDECDVASAAINVEAVNDPPSFSLVASVATNEDAGVTTLPNFASERSPGPTDEAGQAMVFDVDVDDPDLFAVAPAIDAEGTLTFTPAPELSGSTTITVTARDGGGTVRGGSDRTTDTAEIIIRTVNDPPSAILGVNVSLQEDLGSQRRPDWITNISVGPANESTQTANFRISVDRPELFETIPTVSSNGALRFTPASDAVGIATLTIAVVDSGGASTLLGERTIELLEVNDAPGFTLDGDVTVLEDSGPQTVSNFVTDVTAGPSSERSQTVTFTLSNDSAGLFTAPPVLDDDGTLSFTPAPDAFGSAEVTVEAMDDGGTDIGGSDRTQQAFTLAVTSVNGIPVAVGEQFDTDEDTSFTTGNVLANDSDEEGPLDASRIEILQDVEHGALTANGDGSFDYTPDLDFNGTDGFTYRVADADGAPSNAVKANIEVRAVNDDPVASDDAGAGFATTEDTPFTTASVLANDSDVEGTLAGANLTVIATVPPAAGSIVHNGDGTFNFSPAADFNGATSFTYRITDDDGAPSNTATVTISVSGENDPPVGVADFGVGFETTEETPFTTADVTVNDTDIDDTIDPTTVVVVADAVGGVLTNNGDGTFYYEPNIDFAGADAFTYRVNDDGGLTSNTVTVNLVVTGENDAPVAVNDGTDGSIRTNEDTPFTTPNVLANDYDVDDLVDPSSVGVSVGAGNGSLVYNGDGTFDYTPDPDFVGQEDIQYTIQDPAGARSERAILRIFVDAQNDRPVANPDSGVGFTTSEGQLLTTIDVTDNDTDIDSPIVPSSAVNTSTPNNGSLSNNGDGTFDYQPDPFFNGTDGFTYTITDADGATSDPVAVTITITAVNDKPVAADDGGVGFEGVEGSTFTTADVTANDTDPEDTTVDAATVVVVDDPTSGTLTNNGDGTFDYEPDPNSNGADSFTYRVADSGGLLSDAATVTLSIAAVNDAPSFTRGPNLTMIEGIGAVSIPDWATNIQPGPANESGQTVTFTVVTANPEFFDVQPSVDAAGELSMDVADGVSGTTTLTITAVDGGGTANGGVDTSAAVVVDILISPEDFDGVDQATDNAPGLFNPRQIDTDGDGIGDVADLSPTAPGSTGVFTYSTIESDEDLKGTDGVAADFDGDGRLDLAISTEDNGTFVWLNTGAGVVFTSPDHYDSDDEVQGIASADLNGDGHLDFVTAQVGGGNETWINAGDGTFSVDQTLGAFDSHDVALGDLDGDGDVDVVSANYQDHNAIRMNDGAGNFTLTQVFGADNAKSRAVAIDDIDGDFDLDIVIGNEGQANTVWINDGTGNFTDSGQALGSAKTWDIVLVDFNRDGVADLAAAADNDPDTIWMNSGNGTFVDTGQSLGNGHTRSLTTGDVDGDGDIDIVYGDHSAANSVWLNDGSQNFSDSGESVSVAGDTEAVVLADFTGDGALDIVSTRNGNKSRFYVGGIN